MAGSTTTDSGRLGESFGRVSRTVGIFFRYLLLAATLVGIVALGILLAFVANDAFQPLTAEPAWLATAGVTMVGLPVAVGAWLAWRHPDEFRSGAGVLGFLFVGALYAGGVVIVFTDVIPPVVWFSFAVALAVPAVVVVGLERYDDRLPYLVRVVAVLATLGLSLWVLPGLVQSVPVLPADWVILLVTLGGPVAGVLAWYVGARFEERRSALAAGGGAFALTWAAGLASLAIGIQPAPVTVLVAVSIAPTIVYAGSAVYDRGWRAIGLAFPLVTVGGVVAGLALERVLTLAGPESWFTWGFLTSVVSSPPTEAGIYPGIAGSILLMITVAISSFPVGVGAAIYLEEYAPDTRFTRIVDVNISNLAGVPSVVYGLLGLGAFIRFGGLAPGTVVVGGLTLALLILPIVIISAREAIRAVPDSRRQAAYGMGATRWQAVRSVVLPEALPGILTGTILALGRAVGETAPLLVIGAPALFGVPTGLEDRVGAIPLQIYTWASTFAEDAFFTTVLAAGVVTILVVLLTMNSIAIVLRNKFERDS